MSAAGVLHERNGLDQLPAGRKSAAVAVAAPGSIEPVIPTAEGAETAGPSLRDLAGFRASHGLRQPCLSLELEGGQLASVPIPAAVLELLQAADLLNVSRPSMSWLPRPRSWVWATEVNRFTVIYDACVLYPAPLRDLLMRLALTDLYWARWSNQIHEEWITAVLRNRHLTSSNALPEGPVHQDPD